MTTSAHSAGLPRAHPAETDADRTDADPSDAVRASSGRADPVRAGLDRLNQPGGNGQPAGVSQAHEVDVLGLVDYRQAWQRQRDVHALVQSGTPGRVLLLQHPPVFTCGKRTGAGDRPLDPGGAEVIDVDRGGKITFHGPGQLVGYPIVRLPDHVKVVDYVRRVEEALIATCRDFEVTTARVPGRSGVWLAADARGPERKIGALGIRVSRGVTMHGFALNCDIDLSWYDRFVPCGISDAGVTSLSAELGRDVTVAEVIPRVRRHLATYLDWTPYTRTPDYAPRPTPTRPSNPAPNNPGTSSPASGSPEPSHPPRIDLITPGAPAR